MLSVTCAAVKALGRRCPAKELLRFRRSAAAVDA